MPNRQRKAAGACPPTRLLIAGPHIPGGPYTLPELSAITFGAIASGALAPYLGIYTIAAAGMLITAGVTVSRRISGEPRSLTAMGKTTDIAPHDRGWPVSAGVYVQRHAQTISTAPSSRAGTHAPDAVMDSSDERAARAARIAAVHGAVCRLDSEWLEYEQDLQAYYLTKPLLRDAAVPQTSEYQDALFALRDLADALTPASDEHQISTAEDAAETALLAWGAANDYAARIGISDRSFTERVALRRLHTLVGQLIDPGTPKQMWPTITAAISREMQKLTTIATSWEHINRLPALGRHPALAALPQTHIPAART